MTDKSSKSSIVEPDSSKNNFEQNAPFVDNRVSNINRRIAELEETSEKTMRLVNYVLSLFKPDLNRDPDEVLTFICMYHNVTEDQLKATKSNPQVTAARQDYVLQLSTFTVLTVEEIAKRVYRTPKYVRSVYTKSGRKL